MLHGPSFQKQINVIHTEVTERYNNKMWKLLFLVTRKTRGFISHMLFWILQNVLLHISKYGKMFIKLRENIGLEKLPKKSEHRLIPTM